MTRTPSRGRSRVRTPPSTKGRGKKRRRVSSTSSRRGSLVTVNTATAKQARMPKAKKKLDKRILKYVNAGKGRGHYKKNYAVWNYATTGADNVANRQGVYEFYHCQPKQMLDAISVLFNGKTKNANYNLDNGNFGFDLISNSYTLDPDFTISSCVTTYKATNTSQVPITLELYPMLAKQDSLTKTVIDAWQDSINENLYPPTPIVKPSWYGMKMSDVPGELGRYWSGTSKMKTVTIEPGRSKIVHKFVTGFTDVNWEDMQIGNQIMAYKKGITQSLVVVHKLPVSYCPATNTAGHRVVVPTGAGGINGGLCWEIEENWHAICPQIATESNNKDIFVLLHDYDVRADGQVYIYPSKPAVRNVYQPTWINPPTGGVENANDHEVMT